MGDTICGFELALDMAWVSVTPAVAFISSSYRLPYQKKRYHDMIRANLTWTSIQWGLMNDLVILCALLTSALSLFCSLVLKTCVFA